MLCDLHFIRGAAQFERRVHSATDTRRGGICCGGLYGIELVVLLKVAGNAVPAGQPLAQAIRRRRAGGSSASARLAAAQSVLDEI
ncbi:hypothetical protein B1987_06760 [Mycobacterium kansasii]|nr:hypothetical protein B1987_06760 [Mycobacterium kansasii]